MTQIVEIASNISTPLALAGLLAAIFFFVLRQILAKDIFPKLTKSLGAGIIRAIIDRLFVLALVAMILGFAGFLVSVAFGGPKPVSYQVRVTVLSPDGEPVEDIEVWSSLGGEKKKVSGGAEFEIPARELPKTSVTFFASKPNAFLKGEEKLVLGDDYNPSVTVRLHKDASAEIRGRVVDDSGRGLADVTVSVTGFGSEAVLTGEDGSFLLPAHAADGQQVLLHAERKGFEAIDSWHPAGDFPATLRLRQNR